MNHDDMNLYPNGASCVSIITKQTDGNVLIPIILKLAYTG